MHVFVFALLVLIIASVTCSEEGREDVSLNTINGAVKETTVAPQNTTINRRIAAWNGRILNRTADGPNSSPSATLNGRALINIPLPGEDGSSSLETNFLSIQTGSIKAINGAKSLSKSFNQPGVSSGIDPSCRCEAYADCRDVSAFARADRNRADLCPAGTVLCCANRRPQPVPILVPSVQPVPGNPVAPVGAVTPPNQGCGIKGGNPLARTYDAANPSGTAEFGEYPWMTAILKTDLSYVCGGALIDARVVLTAAHCVAKVKNEDLIVRLGEYDVSELSEPPYQDIHIKRVIIHADYHSGTLRNDVALLILDKPVSMNNYIRPICLPPATDFTGQTCTVSGWGKNNPVGQYSNILKEVDVPVMDNGRCQSALRSAPELGPVFNLHNSFLCAGVPGKDACAGDGGSPLVCRVDGVYRLAGLVSWGINCGQYPGVYTRVSNFLPWIMSVLQENPLH